MHRQVIGMVLFDEEKKEAALKFSELMMFNLMMFPQQPDAQSVLVFVSPHRQQRLRPPPIRRVCPSREAPPPPGTLCLRPGLGGDSPPGVGCSDLLWRSSLRQQEKALLISWSWSCSCSCWSTSITRTLAVQYPSTSCDLVLLLLWTEGFLVLFF